VCSCFVRLLAPFRLRLSSSSPAPFGVWFRWGWWADYLMGLWCVSPRDFFSSLLMFREETVAPCGGQFLIGFSALILPLVPNVFVLVPKRPGWIHGRGPRLLPRMMVQFPSKNLSFVHLCCATFVLSFSSCLDLSTCSLSKAVRLWWSLF